MDTVTVKAHHKLRKYICFGVYESMYDLDYMHSIRTKVLTGTGALPHVAE